MRKILFRGRWIKGDWVEGYYVFKGGVPYIVNTEDEDWYEGEWFQIDPRTVGQYTGLKDKNGKRIFEGDILRLGGYDLPNWRAVGEACEVKYNDGGFDPMCEYDIDCEEYVCAKLCEVIGNIHDNPELLEATHASD